MLVSNKTEESNNMSNYEYPMNHKRKRKSKKQQQQQRKYKLEEPPHEQFFVGYLDIGRCTTCCPIEIHPLRAYFDISKEVDSLILEEENNQHSISLDMDTAFVLGLLQTSYFFYKFHKAKDSYNILMKIYFKSLPITKSSKQNLQYLCKLFIILFDVGSDDLLNKKKRKLIDTYDKIENIYKSVREKQGAAELIQGDEAQIASKQSKWLKPTLRPYQSAAVDWMLKKENSPTNEMLIHPAYIPVKIASGLEVFFNPSEGSVTLEKQMVAIGGNGGILADDMGLGKTIELLGLVLLDFEKKQIGGHELEPYERPPIRNLKTGSVTIERQPKRPSYEVIPTIDTEASVASIPTKDITRNSLALFYANNVFSVWDTKTKEVREVSCICGSIVAKNLVQCEKCKKKQHFNCVGYKESNYAFKCVQCWSSEDLLSSQGTLIVCPASLRQQWLNEIEKHVNCNLKVLDYSGSNVLTPVYPTKLAQYDIVITTYQVLQNEFHLADQCASKSLRHQRKYSSPGVSIPLVFWRRLCLDEAQTVESTTTMVAEMAKRLTARYRWAITGTPVSVSISDIYGLVEYLHLEPFNDLSTFTNVLYKPYLAGNEQPLVQFLSGVLWRTQKVDVLDQINIPQQTTRHHRVAFTEIEQYFYDCETKESQKVFLQKLAKYDLSTPLVSLKVSDLNNLLMPIVSLRRVCVHHNVVRGRYLVTKKPVNSMQELLDALISRNISDCEDNVRLLISSLNGLAGIYILLENPLTAAQQYLEVMQLEERFLGPGEGALSIDKLPLVHMYYNLRQLILADEHLVTNLSNLIQKDLTLTVDHLKTKQELIEQEYIQKFELQTKTLLENLNVTTNKISELEGAITCETWYADIVVAIFGKGLKRKLSQRVNKAWENMQTDIKVRSVFRPQQSIIIENLMAWIDKIATLREEAMTAVNALFEISHDNRIVFTPHMVETVVDCHLRPDKRKPIKNDCPLCVSHKILLKYEKVLFNEETEKVDKQFSWKPCQQEIILQTMLRLVRHKLKSPEAVGAIQDGGVFMEMLEFQKKEFKGLRKEWRLLDGQIAASDELVLCKMLLRLRNEASGEKKPIKSLRQLSYEVKNNLETINEILEDEVDMYRYSLQNEGLLFKTKLEKCLGTNKYLQSLNKPGQQQLDPCPICRGQLSKSYNILTCGHAYCLDCMQTIVARAPGSALNVRKLITCAICRQNQPVADINCVDETLGSNLSGNEEGVVGNCSSKVGQIVRLIKELKRDEAEVKVLVFSTWDSVLKILRDVFAQNNISSELVLTQARVVKGVERFVTQSITALLLPVNLGTKGLNLIEATHVIFAEPILDPAEEMQAIGRVHRFGQTKPTAIHKFIMTGSIEEEIQRVTSSKDNSKWNKTQVTLQQIKDLLFANCQQDVDINDNNDEPTHQRSDIAGNRRLANDDL